MFLRKTPRKKDGKAHDYWSVVENKRVAGGRVVQRRVLAEGNELYVYLAQPDGRNQTRAAADRRWRTGLQSMAAAVDCSVEHLCVCSGAFRPRSRWCLASVPCLLGQQEVETQMHADKKG